MTIEFLKKRIFIKTLSINIDFMQSCLHTAIYWVYRFGFGADTPNLHLYGPIRSMNTTPFFYFKNYFPLHGFK